MSSQNNVSFKNIYSNADMLKSMYFITIYDQDS